MARMGVWELNLEHKFNSNQVNSIYFKGFAVKGELVKAGTYIYEEQLNPFKRIKCLRRAFQSTFSFHSFH